MLSSYQPLLSFPLDADPTSPESTTSTSSSPMQSPHPLRHNSRGDWSAEQDEALRQSVASFGGKNWKRIAAEIPGGKSHVQCLQRWNKVIKPGLVKGPWKKYEDDLLRASTEEIGKNNWVAVSERVLGRTPKQCRERWLLCLDPRIRKDKWTDEEDKVLLELHEKHGNSWAFLAKYLDGRTENAIKSRVKSLLKKGQEQSPPAAKRVCLVPAVAPLFAPVTLSAPSLSLPATTPPSLSLPTTTLPSAWPASPIEEPLQPTDFLVPPIISSSWEDDERPSLLPNEYNSYLLLNEFGNSTLNIDELDNLF